MEELRARYGSRAVSVEYEAPIDQRFTPAGARVRNRYPRSLELQLEEGTDPGALLRELAAAGPVRRFEAARPSLHSIFVELVKGEAADA